MKLVRIDALSRGAHPLELHPSLTVLLGASPEQRRRLAEVVAAVGGSGAVPADAATVDLHGVLMPLDAATTDLLRTDAPLAPVLRPTALTTSSVLTAGDGTGDVAGNPEPPATLAEMAQARAELGRRTEELRALLDPLAEAAVASATAHRESVAAGAEGRQTERQELRRAAQAERAALIAASHELHDEVQSLEAKDPQRLVEVRDQLLVLLDGPGGPDPDALDLAEALDVVMAEEHTVEERRAAAERQLATAEVARAEARAQVDRIEQAQRSPVHDPDLTNRLERVRDQIYAPGTSSSEMDELRATEAELLDALGYETYTAYVTGVPNARALAEHTAALHDAASRLESATDEVVRLRAVLPDEGVFEELESRRTVLMGRAHHLLADAVASGRAGSTATTTVRTDERRPEVLAELLREVRLASPSADDPNVLAATEALRDHLVLVGAEVGWVRSPTEVAAVAETMVERLADVPERLVAARRRAESLDAEVARIEAGLVQTDDAELDVMTAEVRAADARLAAAQARVVRHHEVQSEMDGCRAAELRLREAEQRLTLAPVPTAVPAVPAPAVTPWQSVEWELTCGIGARRATTVGGSVPVLVDGLPSDPDELGRVLARLAALGPLVQSVVLCDDPAAAVWAEAQGPAVARAVRC